MATAIEKKPFTPKPTALALALHQIYSNLDYWNNLVIDSTDD